jgi:hypothetical protein
MVYTETLPGFVSFMAATSGFKRHLLQVERPTQESGNTCLPVRGVWILEDGQKKILIDNG